MECIYSYFVSLNMHAVGWTEALQHVETPLYVSLSDVRAVADEIWAELRNECNLSRDANLAVFMDVTQDGVLAYTRRTLLLRDEVWKPSIMYEYNGVDIELHFNPNVPHGWYDGTDCNTGWRYDLRTVMRHELLHGVGLSSSIRHSLTATSVGYSNGISCYPTFYDTRLESGGVPIVDGCTYLGGSEAVYMAGRKVYVPDNYRIGSSYSHHDEEGLFRWQLAPRHCHTLGGAEYDMLEGLDYNCSVGKYMLSGGQKLNASLWLSLLSCALGVTTGMAASRSTKFICFLSIIIASVACLNLQ